jgi:DNA invertase Pin-like site-specific DNA recombinase
MKIGYLRSDAPVEELQTKLEALEKAGCERVLVDTGQKGDHHAGTLGAILSRLSDGDSLILWSLDAVACSMPQLIQLALELDARNVRLRSLSEGFDTAGKYRPGIITLLRYLQQFQNQLTKRYETLTDALAGRRPGRPRSLSKDDVERARSLVDEGLSIDEAARQFQVSRATLYRYLQDRDRLISGFVPTSIGI